jgi:hypothetical protein
MKCWPLSAADKGNKMETLDVIWPPHYAPGNSPVHVRNELAMQAAPELVWAWLVRARD